MTSKINRLMQPGQRTCKVLYWLLQRDTTGCFAPVARAEIGRQFSAHDGVALDNALLELERCGLVRRQSPPPRLCGATSEIATPIAATLEAALQAGLHATGHDIDGDAIRIARKFLKNDRYLNIPALYDRLGWELRRLNPPLLLIRSLLGAENFSAEPSMIFAFIDFSPTNQTRTTLKAWIEQGSTIATAPSRPAQTRTKTKTKAKAKEEAERYFPSPRAEQDRGAPRT